MDLVAPSRTPEPGPLDAVSEVVPLSVGQEFDCFQNFKAAVYGRAVDSNQPARLDKSDRLRNLFRCKTSADYEFKARAIWKANKEKVFTLLATYQYII